MSRASPVVSIHPDQGGSVQVLAGGGWWIGGGGPTDMGGAAWRGVKRLLEFMMRFRVGVPCKWDSAEEKFARERLDPDQFVWSAAAF